MLASVVLVLVIFGGLLCLGLGAFALYEGFAKSEGEPLLLGNPRTARIVGIVALLFGLLLICLPLVFFFYMMGVQPQL